MLLEALNATDTAIELEKRQRGEGIRSPGRREGIKESPQPTMATPLPIPLTTAGCGIASPITLYW